MEPSSGELAAIVARNIRALCEVRERQERDRGFQERLSDAITGFTGSMAFVFLHAIVFGGWLILNSGWFAVRPWDPFPFVMLAMIASVEAIFLSTFVLISQNRMQALADRRAELDLQINLLAEHEVTRLIQMVDEIRTHLGITEQTIDDLDEIKNDVQPEVVISHIEEAETNRDSA